MIRNRRGFSLTETMVSVGIMASVAAVVTPSVNDYLERVRLDKMKGSLEGFALAVEAFSNDVKRTPGTMKQLSQAITTADASTCGVTYTSGLANAWGGPYIVRAVTGTQVPMAAGIARTVFGRDAVQNHLILYIDDVRVSDAAQLNDIMDGDLDTPADPATGNATGGVQWNVPNSEGVVTLRYHVPIPSNCTKQ